MTTPPIRAATFAAAVVYLRILACAALPGAGAVVEVPGRANHARPAAAPTSTVAAAAKPSVLRAAVEVEEEVYRYQPANNGAGPMWCSGNTCIVRAGARVFASGIETLADAQPLSNCAALLFTRTEAGWQLVYKSDRRTREPSPLAVLPDRQILLSINPTVAEPGAAGGCARPEILEFAADAPQRQFRTHLPVWDGQPPFTEHSYRSFAVDGGHGALILLQNIGFTHAEWTFRDRHGQWAARGKLVWPWGAEYDKPQPVRVCYPAVALKDRAVYFCGVSDIVEPYQVWRDTKKELTGRQWDYDFRRLFFTWTDDITTGKFHDWVEVVSRDKTGGWILPCDLVVDPGGDVFVLWTERAIDERLRERFFPHEQQRYALECAVLRAGKVVRRTTIAEGGEGLGGARPGNARFQWTDDGRLWVLYYVGGTDTQGNPVAENRLVEMLADGTVRQPITVKLQQPLAMFFTATVRAGCQPSDIVDVLGQSNQAIRYVKIRLID